MCLHDSLDYRPVKVFVDWSVRYRATLDLVVLYRVLNRKRVEFAYSTVSRSHFAPHDLHQSAMECAISHGLTEYWYLGTLRSISREEIEKNKFRHEQHLLLYKGKR